MEIKKQLISLAISKNALIFGDFTLKSGRKSPYFFNIASLFDTEGLSFLGKCYATTIMNNNLPFDQILGLAYKGIPLATTTACSLYELNKKIIPVSFNRKEAKTHGEGGTIMGQQLEGKILIIDDVITAGTAINEALELISQSKNKAQVAGIVITLDRQEIGNSRKSALQEIVTKYKIPVISIINLDDIILYISQNNSVFTKEILDKMKEYRQEYHAYEFD